MKVHPDDYDAISRQHSAFIDGINGINDAAVAFQDSAYETGRNRGLQEGKELRDELLGALDDCVRRMAAGSPEADEYPFIKKARAAIAKARGES